MDHQVCELLYRKRYAPLIALIVLLSFAPFYTYIFSHTIIYYYAIYIYIFL